MSTKAYYLLSKVLIPIALVVGAIVPNLISSRLFAQTITSSVSSRQCEKANIKDSINKLETGDIAAFDFLVACDSKAVFSLIELLDDEDENLRIITIAILGEIGEGATNAIPFFEEILKDTQKNNEDSRLMVVNALEKMGQPAVPALITALQDDDYHVSYSAVGALSEIGQPAVPTLIAALQDEDYRVRSSAVGALGEIGKPAVPALIAALQDDDYRVRSSAVGALGEIGKPAVPALIAALQDEDSRVRYRAAEALGEIGAEAKDAVSSLTRVAKNDKCLEPRLAAIESLTKINPNQVDTFSSQPKNISLCYGNLVFSSARALATVSTSVKETNPPIMCSYPLIKTILPWKCP